MATYVAYTGHRPILPGQNYNDWVNTYTHKVGVYSNWSLMTTDPLPLTGDPVTNRVPGHGPYGEGDLFLSRVFLGLDQNFSRAKNSLVGAGNPVQNDFYGRYNPSLFRGLPSSRILDTGTLGHIAGGGRLAAYAEWSNYVYSGLVANQVMSTSTLGHPERFTTDKQNTGTLGPRNAPIGQAESFGAFEPYLYKGVLTERSDPLSSGYKPLGHPYWPPSVTADSVPSDYGQIPAPRIMPDHYGQEHTREWFGVPSAKAL